jgi:hypothetical protein
MRFGIPSAMLLAVAVLPSCGEPPQSSAPPAAGTAASAQEAGAGNPVDAFGPGWTTVLPGGDTVCSDGSDYRFFVRAGDPQRLAVYFQGGGACWFGENCDPHLNPSYKPGVSDDEPGRHRGIFDFEHPDNPFIDYSMVMVPYCTADVHLGSNVVEYQAPEAEDHEAHSLTIHHKGLVNAQAALDWTYTHFPGATEIFVSGSSAGAIPSPYYAWLIADAFPDARIAHLGDGAGGYRRGGETTFSRMSQWGTLQHLRRHPEFAEVTDSDFTYESLYIAAARRHPDIVFAQYDAAEDSVQRRFLAMGGSATDTLLTGLRANHDDIRAEVDNFRVFIAGGDSHTILARPEFYTFHVGGVRIRDWVADLARFEDVDDVACDPCIEAEVLEAPAIP